MKKFFPFNWIFFVLPLFFPGVTMAIEEPTYKLESKNNDYEIRHYNSLLVAETLVQADFDEAGNRAFRILADYIFGNNKSKTKMAMTAPVTQQPPSEKMAMTAPVNLVKSDSGYTVQFTMPSGYTLQTLPEPNDKRVVLREISSKRMAVYSYSGSWSQSRYEKKLHEFKEALKRDSISTVGEPIFARYNSPFQLWFLRRNEIWLEVTTTH
jgi:hypothetical protein